MKEFSTKELYMLWMAVKTMLGRELPTEEARSIYTRLDQAFAAEIAKRERPMDSSVSGTKL